MRHRNAPLFSTQFVTIKDESKEVVIVASTDCIGCIFYKKDMMRCPGYACTQEDRKDENDIIFQEVIREDI